MDGVLGESGEAYLWSDGDGQYGEAYQNAGLWPTSETLPSAQTEDGVTVLLPQPEREKNIAPDDPFPVVAVGIAEDGRLHVRVRNQVGAVWSDLSIAARFPRGEDPEPGERFTVTNVDNDIDFCLEACGLEELDRLEDIWVFGYYSAQAAPVDGNWSLEFPLQTTEALTVPVSLTLPARPDGMTVEGDTAQASGAVKSIRFEQFIPSVTFRDGTQQTASLADAGTWWATWTFDQPIDPEQVVSITLNGQTIPVEES